MFYKILFVFFFIIFTTPIEVFSDTFKKIDNGKPFTCDIGTILFNTKEHQSTTNFYTVDLATGQHQTVKENFYNHPINAIGYNVVDNYIWGYDLRARKVVRVDKDTNVITYDIAKLPNNAFYIGDVSKDGILYLANNDGKVYKVDVNPQSLTYLKYLGSIDLSIPNIKIGDFAFNPKDGYIYTVNEGRIDSAPRNTDVYQIDPSTGRTVDVGSSGLDLDKVDFHSYLFDKNGDLYAYGKQNIVYKISLSKGETKAVRFTTVDFDSIGGDGARCPNTEVKPPEGVCYAISDVKNKLYKVYLDPNADPLPLATKIDITGTAESINSEGGAYYSQTGMVYAFHESDNGPKLYAINPNTGEADYIKIFDTMKSNIVGASFYGGYFYVIAKNGDGDAVLYKILPDEWRIISFISLNGDTTDADALAINTNGEAYIVLDGKRELYSIDLNTARTKYKFKITTKSEPEALSFAKDGNLYVADSEDGVSYDTDKIYKIDLLTGKLTAAAQISRSDDIDIEGLSCNVISSSAPTCDEGENLIKNGSFNLGENTPDWTGDFWTGESYDTPDGKPYVYVDKDHDGYGYQDVPIEAGKSYKLTFYAAMSNSFIDQKVSMEYLDENKNSLDILSKVDITHNVHDDNKLIPYSLSISEAPKNAKYIRVQFSTKNGDFLKVDGFDLRVNCDSSRGVSITDSQLGEGEAANGQKMKFTIATNLPAPKGGLTVKYKIISKTAVVNSDFLANTKTDNSVTIPEGERSVDIYVTVIDDKKKEDAEYFEIELEPIDGIKMPDPKAIGVILDNDEDPIGKGKNGYFIINDKGYSDGKLRTKISGTSPVVVIKAKSGFEIVHNRVRNTYTNCVDSCVCDPCGGPVCTQTCASYSNYKDENSSKMYIDKIVLYYHDGTTYQLSDAKQVKSGDSFELVVPTDKITKDAYIKVFGHSDKEYATGKSKDLTSISDHFAIRPDRFKISLGAKNLINPLIAEENVNMIVKTVDTSGNIKVGYNGKNFLETLVDDKYSGSQLMYGLDISGLSFINGVISKSVSYKEVGKLTLKIEEKAPYFAQIDKDDNPATYKISPGIYEVRVIPDRFDISYILKDNNPSDNITFYANDLSKMASSLSYKVTAKGKLGRTTTRYTSGKYSDDVYIKVAQQVSTTPTRTLTLNYKDNKTAGHKTFISSSEVNLDFVLNQNDFLNGVSSDVIYENFKRDNTKAENPLTLSMSKITAQEKTGVGSIKVSGVKNDASQKAYFYYARAHAPSPQSTDQNILYAKIYYEVYCKRCNKVIYTQAGGSSSIDSVYWYILPSSTVSNFGTSVCNYTNPRAIDMTDIDTLNHDSADKIKIKASKVPSKNKIFYTPVSGFLQYNKFGTYLPEHYFDIIFVSANSVWAGEGEKGSTVDTDISKKHNKSLDW